MNGPGRWHWIVAVLAGYALACASVVVIIQTWEQWPFTPVALANGWLLTAWMSLPGFVVLRLGMWAGGVAHWAGFMAAGAVNSVAALSYFRWEFLANEGFVMVGAVAAAVYWLTERRMAGGTLARNGASGPVVEE